MKILNKIFWETKITYKRLLAFAVLIGGYTGLVMTVPFLKDTSFRDIGIGYEWWILFAIIIITNSKKPLESAIKVFLFFLISQPIVYLIQPSGLVLFLRYYRNWIMPTVATIPMAFIGWYIRKEKFYSPIILSPMLLFLFVHLVEYFSSKHILSGLFCSLQIVGLVIGVLKKRSLRIIAIAVFIIGVILLYIFYYRTH